MTDTTTRNAILRKILSDRRREVHNETLTLINEALFLLDAGQYGSCVECENEISEGRLRALPFAVRCQACEERGSLWLFEDAAGS